MLIRGDLILFEDWEGVFCGNDGDDVDGNYNGNNDNITPIPSNQNPTSAMTKRLKTIGQYKMIEFSISNDFVVYSDQLLITNHKIKYFILKRDIHNIKMHISYWRN